MQRPGLHLFSPDLRPLRRRSQDTPVGTIGGSPDSPADPGPPASTSRKGLRVLPCPGSCRRGRQLPGVDQRGLAPAYRSHGGTARGDAALGGPGGAGEIGRRSERQSDPALPRSVRSAYGFRAQEINTGRNGNSRVPGDVCTPGTFALQVFHRLPGCLPFPRRRSRGQPGEVSWSNGSSPGMPIIVSLLLCGIRTRNACRWQSSQPIASCMATCRSQKE